MFRQQKCCCCWTRQAVLPSITYQPRLLDGRCHSPIHPLLNLKIEQSRLRLVNAKVCMSYHRVVQIYIGQWALMKKEQGISEALFLWNNITYTALELYQFLLKHLYPLTLMLLKIMLYYCSGIAYNFYKMRKGLAYKLQFHQCWWCFWQKKAATHDAPPLLSQQWQTTSPMWFETPCNFRSRFFPKEEQQAASTSRGSDY